MADRQHGNDEDTALRPGCSAAQDGLANGMRGEKMVLSHQPAVGDAVEEGLPPVPRGVKANRPPERTRPPEAKAEDEPG